LIMNPVPWLQMTNMISYQGLVRTFPRVKERYLYVMALISIRYLFFFMGLIEGRRILNPARTQEVEG
ncbi:hypothetical protein RZP91_25215, partial [Citrobacter freundii]|uniref:hypothetical protein n=1 Tax=Citrobacter freundii TaxID=546 RepID=UPI00292B805D|nr:hypothetical protein [Citrobacter freundii]MEB0339965.1 hypothetical protein [Citrobacter freundii]